VASHVFGPSTTQVDPDLPDRESRQTTNWHHTDDSSSFHKYFAINVENFDKTFYYSCIGLQVQNDTSETANISCVIFNRKR